MTVHRPHPIRGETWEDRTYHDPDDAVLYDDCERCAELARSPATGLSIEYAERLWRRMVAVEKDDARGYATHTEARAGRVYYAIALFLERNVPAVDPWRWPIEPGPSVPIADAVAALLDAATRTDDETCPAEWHHLESRYGCLLEPDHAGDHVGIRGEPACSGCGGYDDHTRDCPRSDRGLPPGSDVRFTFTDEEADRA